MFRLPKFRSEQWMEQALCAQIDPELFFAEKGEWSTTIRAKLVCQSCAVRDECLSYAVRNGENHGVWGGTTPEQRKRLRNHRGLDGLAS